MEGRLTARREEHIVEPSGGTRNEQQDGSGRANYRRRSHRYYAVHAASVEQRNKQASCIQRVHEGKSQRPYGGGLLQELLGEA